MASQIATMRALAEEAEEIIPPDKFKEVHSTYMNGIREYKWVADNLPKAIDDLDIDLINECTAKLLIGNEYVAQATIKMDEITAQ